MSISKDDFDMLSSDMEGRIVHDDTLISRKDNEQLSEEEYYQNGQKRYLGNYLNGKREGRWVWWYEDGQKSYERNYANGMLNGFNARWYEDGQKSYERNYANGKLVGRWTSWYKDGQKMSEFHYIAIAWDGPHTLTCRHGPWTFWNADGQKRYIENYVWGVWEGHCIRWHKNGQKKQEGNFKNGRKEGPWTFWNADGKVIKSKTYKNGGIVK